MPYQTNSGGFERASRLGHATAAVRALAERASFHVPAEHIADTAWLADRIRPRSDLPVPDRTVDLRSALAIDGSHVVQSIRDGMPSVVYGYAQAAAAYVDLSIMESQRARRFVDPVAIAQAVTTALVQGQVKITDCVELVTPGGKLRSDAAPERPAQSRHLPDIPIY